MVIIVALIVILLVVHRILHSYSKRYKDNTAEVYTMVVCYLASIIILIPIIIFVPFQGYHEKVCTKEIQLVALQSEDGKATSYYLEQEEDSETEYKYAFEKKEKYEEDTKAIDEVKEEKESKKAVIKIFKSEPKRSLFTIAAAANKTEVIAYIPEGTVLTNEAKEDAEKKAEESKKETKKE